MKNASANKVGYLEGIRGVAAFLVLIHHFMLAFYPAFYDGKTERVHAGGLEVIYARSPLSVLTNGNFCVTIFFVLSGFVLSRKYFLENKFSYLVSAAQRRFFRLFIPVGFTLLCSYILLYFSLYQNREASEVTLSDWWLGNLWDIDTSFGIFLQHFFYRVMFLGDAAFDTSLWTISTELYGSMLVFALLALSHNTKRKIFILCCLFYYFYITDNYYYCAFLLGIALNYIESGILKPGAGLPRSLISIGFFALGLLLGAFPSSWEPNGTPYPFITDPKIIAQFPFIHVTGAFLLLYAVVISPLLQKIFSTRLCVFLGFISFSLYLIHPLVIGSFSCGLFLGIYEQLGYNQSALLIFILTVLITVLLSYFMTLKIDRYGIAFSKKFHTKWIGEIKPADKTE